MVNPLPSSLAAVSRRPEYPGTWQLHGAEADA